MTIKRVFTGPQGLRAGWSIVIFVSLLAIMVAIRSGVLRWVGAALAVPQDQKNWLRAPSLYLLLREGSLLILTLGATWIMSRIERRRLWSYGLAGRHSIRNLTLGSLGGIAFCSLVVGMMAFGGHFAFDGLAVHGFAILEYGLYWALFGFLVAFFEETLFRGYFQHTMARGIGFWPAAICCSFAFGFAHVPNSGEDIAGIAVVILGGIFLSQCLKLSGSLWFGIGFHTTFGWGELFVFGAANSGNAPIASRLLSSRPIGNALLSGGDAGPEGSLICVGLMTLLIVLTAAAARHGRTTPGLRAGRL